MDQVGFYDVLSGALKYMQDGADLMRSFYECLPAPVQVAVFSIFVVIFGFAVIMSAIRMISG